MTILGRMNELIVFNRLEDKVLLAMHFVVDNIEVCRKVDADESCSDQEAANFVCCNIADRFGLKYSDVNQYDCLEALAIILGIVDKFMAVDRARGVTVSIPKLWYTEKPTPPSLTEISNILCGTRGSSIVDAIDQDSDKRIIDTALDACVRNEEYEAAAKIQAAIKEQRGLAKSNSN